MKTGITKEEALSLLQQAAFEPLGLLVYASDPQPFIQALYRAKRDDPSLAELQIRQNPEGIAICHQPTTQHEEGTQTLYINSDEDETNDPPIY